MADRPTSQPHDDELTTADKKQIIKDLKEVFFKTCKKEHLAPGSEDHLEKSIFKRTVENAIDKDKPKPFGFDHWWKTKDNQVGSTKKQTGREYSIARTEALALEAIKQKPPITHAHLDAALDKVARKTQEG